MEYITGIIIGSVAVLAVFGALFLSATRGGPTESSEGGRAEAIKGCYNLCRDDPKQTFYSCATMCSNTAG